MSDTPVYPRVDEIAQYLPTEAVHMVELAVARWENAQLRELLNIQQASSETEQASDD